MNYNFEERINRVINNHQFTCQHRSHYLFVLKGFEPLLRTLNLNVEHLDVKFLYTHKNFFITYEEAFELKDTEWKTIKDESYDIWIVDFNFFDSAHIALNQSKSHASIINDHDILWVTYHDNPNLLIRKTLNIFNTINPLIGIVKDFSNLKTNQQRYDFLKNSLI